MVAYASYAYSVNLRRKRKCDPYTTKHKNDHPKHNIPKKI